MLSEYLRAYRRKKWISQIEMANLLGVTRNFYSGLETGRMKPGPKTVVKLAEVLKVSPNYVMRLINEDNK